MWPCGCSPALPSSRGAAPPANPTETGTNKGHKEMTEGQQGEHDELREKGKERGKTSNSAGCLQQSLGQTSWTWTSSAHPEGCICSESGKNMRLKNKQHGASKGCAKHLNSGLAKNACKLCALQLGEWREGCMHHSAFLSSQRCHPAQGRAVPGETAALQHSFTPAAVTCTLSSAARREGLWGNTKPEQK